MKKKSVFKRWWFWLIVVIVVIGFANASNEPTIETAAPAETPAEEPTATPEPEPTKAPEPKNDTGVSKAEFESIENGMTYEEVIKIIGGEGEVRSEIGKKGDQFHTITYSFEGEAFMSNATFTFQDGELSVKAQFGLE